MKIEEGMYVRTRNGIAKILGIINDPDNFYYKMLITDKFLKIHDDTEYINDLDVIKASYNIIDLIEVRDYVNGQLVYYDEESECLGQNFVDADSNYYFESITKGGDYKIKTILTKEQYENNCYKVDDK